MVHKGYVCVCISLHTSTYLCIFWISQTAVVQAAHVECPLLAQWSAQRWEAWSPVKTSTKAAEPQQQLRNQDRVFCCCCCFVWKTLAELCEAWFSRTLGCLFQLAKSPDGIYIGCSREVHFLHLGQWQQDGKRRGERSYRKAAVNVETKRIRRKKNWRVMWFWTKQAICSQVWLKMEGNTDFVLEVK